MYNTVHLYDLSFVPPKRRPRTRPQIVFTLESRHLEELNKRLRTLVRRADVETYSGVQAEFRFPVPDLFGQVEFGFGRCGFMTVSGEDAMLRVDLAGGEWLYHSTLTINLLTKALLVPFDEEKQGSNRSQQLDLETLCDNNRPEGYGHAIGGYISGKVSAWIRRQAADLPENWYGHIEVPKQVVTAMRQAWTAVVPQELKRWAKQCNGAMTKDGRFILNCFGNACDVAIYPDSMRGSDELFGTRFDCHNLDSAMQQVTLIAGLARLCELARNEE